MTQIARRADAPLLQIDGLTKTFGGFTALDNVSVDIRKGERFGLIGPNGSGKTTLINCISGALRPQTRQRDVLRRGHHRSCRRTCARAAASPAVFQIPRPFKSMTVLENLMVGARLRRRLSAARRCRRKTSRCRS